MMQATNRHNTADVRAGYVHMRHPLLERGLQIVDMPGVEGVSPEIAQTAKTFVKASSHAVIGVLRRSGYGPMGRILAELLPRDAFPHALVYNSEVENWNSDPTTAKDDAVLREFVEDTRQGVVESLSESWPNLGDHPERISVLYLPSFQARQYGNGTEEWVSNAVHSSEVDRFLSQVWGHVREHGVGGVINLSTQYAGAAIREFQAWLDLRHHLLAAIHSGGEDLVSIRRAFGSIEAETLATWSKAVAPGVLDGRANEAWQPLKSCVDSARDDLINAVHVARKRVGTGKEGALSETEAKAIKAGLDVAAQAANDKIETGQEAALATVVNALLADANSALKAMNERMPIIGASIGTISIDAAALIRLQQVGDLDPTIRERTVHTAGVVGTATVAAMAAGGSKMALLLVVAPFLGPFGALLAGFGLGAVGAHILIKKLFGDRHRRVLTGELDALLQKLAKLDTTKHGNLRKAWGDAVGNIAKDVGRLLEARIAGIASMLQDPVGNRQTLDTERDKIERLEHEIETLERAVEGIVDRAMPLS